MRIGLISVDFHPNVGGVAAHVVELGKALVKLGHEVHVVTLPIADERSRESEFHGMQVHRTPFPKQKPVYSWLTNWWLRQFLQLEPMDVLHVHGLRPVEATRGLNVPVVFTNHTSGFLKRIQRGPGEHRRLADRLKHVAHVLAPSDELVEATKTVGYSGPVTFISNGVDTTRFKPGVPSHRESWQATDDDVVVLLARRLVEKNGVTVFAEAVTQLKDLPVRVIFAGDGDDRGKVESIISTGGMQDACRFLGNVMNTDMPDIYRSADISVLPSFMEATSITGLESMATGLPLVGTRVGGIPALIDDEVSGLLVDPGQPTQIAAAIRRLVESSESRQRMGKRARQRASELFSWDRIARETVAVYQQCSSQRAAA
ncbi:MAG: glycosyltransferase family 4 protein [Planctomycetaceae bacterium]|nr:glycosyltransferase family 4 protein [Planctomycetaceae bacterium]